MNKDNGVPVLSLIAIPAVITLGVTVLRLVGELNGWSRLLFNPAPGGGGALVGIVWLVLIFGGYFGVKLERSGHGPERMGRAMGIALLAIVIVVVGGFATALLKLKGASAIVLFSIASIAGILVGLRAWPALGRTLLAYGLAARIPVAIVMLFAILGSWGTHYDLPPPGFPEYGPWLKWFLIGFLPQLTLWIAFTIAVGTLFGGLAVAVARSRHPAHA